MISGAVTVPEVLKHSPVRVIFGPGKLADLGRIAAAEQVHHVLVVTDPGIHKAGHVDRACESLTRSGLQATVFDGARENPTTKHVAAGVEYVQDREIELIVGLGGGSSMDCAKGINLILTNGGEIADYWGVDKPTQPMLPMIAVPTTTGTGSEAQSFALITDPTTHRKMACGDRRPPTEGGLRPRVALLDPELTVSQPQPVAAAAGIDAIAHAVETAATKPRTDTSRECSRLAWQLLEPSYESSVHRPTDDDVQARMLLGAHLAGAAIELSMLGAAHACANPLTARCGITHGQAVGIMLPHVVRFNAADGNNPYADLLKNPHELAARLTELLAAAGLRTRLTDCGVDATMTAELATAAAEQWTASFNPRPVTAPELETIYLAALN